VADFRSREARMSSTVRGTVIAILISGYAWIFKQPAASMTVALLMAAGLQIVVLLIRRFVAAEEQPLALYIFEMVADGVTVLLFALGVFGKISGMAAAAQISGL
jgi:hypothetical protein